MNKDNLTDLINDDDLGLLEEKKRAKPVLPEDRLSQSFVEIVDFVRKHGREPEKGTEIYERQLASRLEGIRGNKNQKEQLRYFDELNLLDKEVKEIKDVEDIFSDDDLDLLEQSEADIFTLKNVPRESKKLDQVARRKPCKDFDQYEPLFVQVHEDLQSGNKELERFVDNHQLDKGTFFVAGGLLGVIVSADLTRDDQGRRNGRLYCVFENGTESNLLFQSLVRYLTVDYPGKVVVDVNRGEQLFEKDDKKSGYIYVLKSKSDNPEITNIKNLYKIGFSAIAVEDRIKNAETDATFLMAPVEIVSVFECYNMNTQRLERLLHRFFADVKLNIDITDNKGERYTPKEWFIAPIHVVTEVIQRIVDGSIVGFRYDVENQTIVK